MKIEHLAIWTKRLDLMRDFYLERFACSASTKYLNPTSGFSSYFLSFPSGGARIELMTKPAVTTAVEGECHYGYAYFALSLGSEERVREFTEKFRREGVVVEAEPRRTGDGYYESVVADPDGNLIELTI